MTHSGAFRLLAGLALAGCGGSGDDGPRPPGNTDLTLEQACSASCDAQDATKCPGVPPAGQCIDDCIAVTVRFPMCDQVWKNINACMARSPLTCDRVNGGAEVSTDHCGPEIEAFDACTP
jgi:hypothetical protein